MRSRSGTLFPESVVASSSDEEDDETDAGDTAGRAVGETSSASVRHSRSGVRLAGIVTLAVCGPFPLTSIASSESDEDEDKDKVDDDSTATDS